MNWKQTFVLGIASSVLSSLASILYLNIYQEALLVDFSNVVGVSNVIAACSLGCILMVLGYKLILNWREHHTIGWLNIGYSVLSFASIAGVMGFNLPLETESPELFPGLVIPMHFFPALALLTIFPLFKLKTS